MTTNQQSQTGSRTSDSSADTLSADRQDLIDLLRKHRALFLRTVQGLTDDQARERTCVSELTLGGLVKHVAAVEETWARFVVEGPDNSNADLDWDSIDWSNPPERVKKFQEGFRLLPEETLAGVISGYDEVSARTEQLIAGVDLDETHPLPQAPWFEAGASWTNRRVFVHMLAELAQHSGHADIIREGIDGQKSMG